MAKEKIIIELDSDGNIKNQPRGVIRDLLKIAIKAEFNRCQTVDDIFYSLNALTQMVILYSHENYYMKHEVVQNEK